MTDSDGQEALILLIWHVDTVLYTIETRKCACNNKIYFFPDTKSVTFHTIN